MVVHAYCTVRRKTKNQNQNQTKHTQKVPAIVNVSVINDPVLLPDGPAVKWQEKVVGAHVANYIAAHSIDAVYTFDAGGVSGHSNHRDVALGVAWLLIQGRDGSTRSAESIPSASSAASDGGSSTGPSTLSRKRSAARGGKISTETTVDPSCELNGAAGQTDPPYPAVPSDVQGYALVTTSVVQKYLGIVDAALISAPSDPLTYFSAPEDVEAIWEAMVAHATQLVTHRRLYLWFSRYVYVNTFEHIE